MFEKGKIWAYPTDTSFGLGVRCDDEKALKTLFEIKNRRSDQYFSLMVRDFKMLQKYAVVPPQVTEEWFFKSPKTIILPAKDTLPESKYWPQLHVAFRVCTIPDIAKHIEVPVTATSANKGGELPAFSAEEASLIFGEEVEVYEKIATLPQNTPSEIWDFTMEPPKRLR